jgi:hypothetical protein
MPDRHSAPGRGTTAPQPTTPAAATNAATDAVTDAATDAVTDAVDLADLIGAKLRARGRDGQDDRPAGARGHDREKVRRGGQSGGNVRRYAFRRS